MESSGDVYAPLPIASQTEATHTTHSFPPPPPLLDLSQWNWLDVWGPFAAKGQASRAEDGTADSYRLARISHKKHCLHYS